MGKPGASAVGSALVTANALNLPAFTWGSTPGMLLNISWTWLPISSLIACPVDL